jgi:hypothetical protein
MPVFQGLINEDALSQILAYLKSLAPQPAVQPGATAVQPAVPPATTQQRRNP